MQSVIVYIYTNKRKLKYLSIIILLLLLAFLSRSYCQSSYVFSQKQSLNINYIAPYGELKEYPDFDIYQQDYSITLKFNNKTWQLTQKDFTPNNNNHAINSAMQKYGRQGKYEEKLYYISKIKHQGFTIFQAYNFVFYKFDSVLQNIGNLVRTEPKNGVINFNPQNYPNMFSLKKEINGQKVDFETLYSDIDSEFNKEPNPVINIKTISIKPEITADYLLKATEKRSVFSTSFLSSVEERKHNIKLALSALNGYRLNAGEIGSFNAITGRRLKEKGYQEANIIKNGLFIPGLGGGVCQVSTTLYNALIRADLKVEEVHKHSIPVSYVELGFDAMVSGSSSDLKFKNTTMMPVFIRAYSQNGRAYIEIYGKSMENIILKPRKEIIKVIPNAGDIIEKDTTGEYKEHVEYIGDYYRVRTAHDGYEVKTYIQYYLNDVLVAEKLLRHIKYDPITGLLIEGTKPKPV
ncbi:MAG: VanW family protein, partial [Clostridia bacterium]|nr:VanW family protein [Clostridia bacterium]